MNCDLQNKLSQLENLIRIQRDSLEEGYMHGMLNGLICAHSVVAKCDPEYVKLAKPGNRIRHKGNKNGKK